MLSNEFAVILFKYKDDPVTSCNYVEGSKLSVSIKRTYANKYYIL